MERVRGIEPLSQPWEGRVLPLNHTRILIVYSISYIVCRYLIFDLYVLDYLTIVIDIWQFFEISIRNCKKLTDISQKQWLNHFFK